MDFGRAIGIAFTTGGARKLKEGEVDETEQVGWGYGLAGVALLVVAQLGLIFYGAGSDLDAAFFRDLGIVAFSGLAVPFVLFWLGAMFTGTVNRLPAAFLYLGVALAVVQVVSAVLTSFGVSQSGFVIGLLAALTFLGARGFLKLHWFPAAIVSLLTVAGIIGAGLLLFVLPSGQLLR